MIAKHKIDYKITNDLNTSIKEIIKCDGKLIDGYNALSHWIYSNYIPNNSGFICEYNEKENSIITTHKTNNVVSYITYEFYYENGYLKEKYDSKNIYHYKYEYNDTDDVIYHFRNGTEYFNIWNYENDLLKTKKICNKNEFFYEIPISFFKSKTLLKELSKEELNKLLTFYL